MYILEQKIAGTVHGILPIGVYRGIYGGPRDKTNIDLESHIELEDGIYQLVSVICYVPGHYVAYYKCNEGDNWIFYNDIGINQSGGGSCEQDIKDIFEKYLSENDFGTLKYEGIIELDFIKGKFKKSDYLELNNIIKKYETEINEFMSQLIEKVVKYICENHLKFKSIKHVINIWYEKSKEIVMQQWTKLIKSKIYSSFKTEDKTRSDQQKTIVKVFKDVENSRIVKIKELIEILREYNNNSFKGDPSSVSPSPFTSRSPSPEPALAKAALPALAKAALPALAKAALPANAVPAPSATRAALRAEAPIYIPIGSLDTWYDKNIPGYPQKEIKQKGKIIGYENNTPRNSATLLFYKKMDQ
jgi:hypothetical protein